MAAVQVVRCFVGEGLVVWKEGPGLFLQGLAVHGYDGTLLEGSLLSHSWTCLFSVTCDAHAD